MYLLLFISIQLNFNQTLLFVKSKILMIVKNFKKIILKNISQMFIFFIKNIPNILIKMVI